MSARRQGWWLRAIAVLFFLAGNHGNVAEAQGCAQCRDNTAATPQVTQHAYRSAILLLGGVALALGSAVIIIGRRFD